MNYYENYENEDYENHEDFQVGSVCDILGYSVTIAGRKINFWLLLLIIIVLGVSLFYRQNKRLPVASDLPFSSTSSMRTIAKQMGGYGSSVSDTPNFIRNLKLY